MDYQELLNSSKAIITADAGCGKTHTIVESLKHITDGKALILTHTHAGVKSFREKASLLQVKPSTFYVTTIHAFALQYLVAFYIGQDIPKQDEKEKYYNFILQKSKNIFSSSIVKEVLKASYKYLFVDEYQDCTKNQHDIIMILSNYFKTYLFGDPMQGIYDFNEEDPIVNWNEDIPKTFKAFRLEDPYRWKSNNIKLGQDIKEIRKQLIDREPIDLNNYKSLIHIHAPQNFQPIYEIYNILTQNKQVLLIDAESYHIGHRIDFASKYKMRFQVMEAITEKDFYTLSKILDDYENNRKPEYMKKLFEAIFKKSIYNYLTETLNLKTKIKNHSDKVIRTFANLYQEFISNYTREKLFHILNITKSLKEIKIYRYELFYDLCKAVSTADYNKTTIYQAMCLIRQNKSILGYKPHNHCIGTTLLTKGLEFDTVILINADKFKDPKNFYVAISRACKKIYIVSPTKILKPYN